MADAVKIQAFGGISPMTHSALLQDGMATVAYNCRMKSGKIVPLREPSLPTKDDTTLRFENGLTSAADAKSMYCWKHTTATGIVKIDLLLFPGDVWFAESNVADDEYDRVFVVGETGISFTAADGSVKKNTPCVYLYSRSSNSISRKTLCKDAMSAPRVSLTSKKDVEGSTLVFTNKGTSTCSALPVASTENAGWVYSLTDGGILNDGEGIITVSAGDTVYSDGENWCTYDAVNRKTAIYYTYYYISWYDSLGYESELSAPSLAKNYGDTAFSNQTLSYNSGDSVHFEPIVVPANAVGMRIYKAVTGNETESIQFVKEISGTDLPKTELGFDVQVDEEDVGETEPEIEAMPDTMTMMSAVPGGYYAGIDSSKPHTVMFSQIDKPYDWPMEYQYDVHDNVVALGVTTNNVFVLTDGYPYVMSGTAPESMTTSVMSGVPAACVSRRGVCIFQNACYFVSNQGLYCIYNDADEGTLCKNVTEKLISKDQWQALNPSSAMIGQYDGAIHMFFTMKDGTHKGLILDLQGGQMTLTTHDEWATCMCTDHRTDDMYFVRSAKAV